MYIFYYTRTIIYTFKIVVLIKYFKHRYLLLSTFKKISNKIIHFTRLNLIVYNIINNYFYKNLYWLIVNFVNELIMFLIYININFNKCL